MFTSPLGGDTPCRGLPTTPLYTFWSTSTVNTVTTADNKVIKLVRLDVQA